MLEGKIISLRAIEEKDLNLLLKWRNNPKFRIFFREYRELNNYDQKKWYQDCVKKKTNTHMFSIIENKTNKLIGACGLCYIDSVNKNADLSIYVGKDKLYIDDIYAIESSHLIIDYGFSVLNLHRIWAEIYSYDKKKIKMFKKLNFELDGIHKETHWENNKWNNSLFYGILSKNYYKFIKKK